MKIPANSTNNHVLSDQISFLDTFTTNSTTNANWITPAYFIPFETPLNSTIYGNNTIQANVTSLKMPN
jgi:hypothetical protein